ENEGNRVRDLEKRLAEALKREAETLEQQTATGALLQEKDRALTEALEQQTATSEILRVISRSQTDVQPVFDAIISSAVRLLQAHSGLLTQVVGDQLMLAALTSTDGAADAATRASFPRPLHSQG